MNEQPKGAASGLRGFLSKLVRDTRANTLAIMGAALIPMAGMVGGGVDISRMYILKTRLQHACDAGALAGRKAMGAGVWSQNNNYPNGQAEAFFTANFESGSFGSSGLTRAFTENAGRVSGTASATLPMTLMRIFGKTTETLTVTCGTEMRLPNTDVMFVLDTTGSMDDPQPGDSVTKMEALKVAVKCFYEIVARLDTDANCTTGAPSGGTGHQVQIRFGFVPYSVNVNVGKLLKPEWVEDNPYYQTRQRQSGGPSGTTGSWSNWANYGWVSCSSIPANTSTVEYRTTSTFWGYCYLEYREYTTNVTSTPVTWRYDRLRVDIRGLKNGTGWNNSFKLPIGNDMAEKTINWAGCIEERATVKQLTYWPIPTEANDLNIDMVPTTDADTQWKPILPDVIYTRRSTGSGTGSWDRSQYDTTTNYRNNSSTYCPTEAKKLQEWPVADAFDTYVDSLTPTGNTYHDIGLIWGARLASPTGLFASENAYTSEGGEIERHIIFMTDGDACTGVDNYSAYGIAWFDRRQTSDSVAPTSGCTETGTLTQQVNARTEAICTAIKNKNFTLWVIAFGNLATTTETRLQNCATSGRYFKATNAATLQQTFKSIADQISMLRLVQ